MESKRKTAVTEIIAFALCIITLGVLIRSAVTGEGILTGLSFLFWTIALITFTLREELKKSLEQAGIKIILYGRIKLFEFKTNYPEYREKIDGYRKKTRFYVTLIRLTIPRILARPKDIFHKIRTNPRWNTLALRIKATVGLLRRTT